MSEDRGGRDMSELETLLKEAQDTNIETKLQAVKGLGSLGDPRAFDVLLAILNKGEAKARGGRNEAQGDDLLAECIFALGKIGGNKLAIPRLREILTTDGYSYAKEEAGQALGMLGDRDFLLTCLGHEDEFTRSYALLGLCVIEKDSLELFDLAAKALQDESVEVIGLAIAALGSIGDPRAIPLIRLFIDKQEYDNNGVALCDLAVEAIETLEKKAGSV